MRTMLLSLLAVACATPALAQTPKDPYDIEQYLPEHLRSTRRQPTHEELVEEYDLESFLPERLRKGGNPNAKPAPDAALPPKITGMLARLRWSGALDAYNAAIDAAQSLDHRKAATLFGQAVKAQPELPEARYGLGLELARLRLYDAALPELQEACRLRPGYLEASKALTRVSQRIASRNAPVIYPHQ